jgi:hypothetical protein
MFPRPQVRLALCAAFLAVRCLCSDGLSYAQVLFDGSKGDLPAGQGWVFLARGSATQTWTAGSVVLDTSVASMAQAGYSALSRVPLNRTNGFTLAFTAQVENENHGNNNRAGFSVILLDNEQRGIELGFWEDRVFAQSDSPLFVHAEDTLFSTTNAFVDYHLSLFETNYVLKTDGRSLLSGPIRDYTAFSGFPNPYRTPNFIFFGDDTSSASVVIGLKEIVLFTPPKLEVLDKSVARWNGVAGKTYHVETSNDLLVWSEVAAVTSLSEVFFYTNTASTGTTFLRLLLP